MADDQPIQNMPQMLGHIANGLTSKLPAQFLALVVINTIFVVSLMWFLHDVNGDRIEAWRQYSLACTAALKEQHHALDPR